MFPRFFVKHPKLAEVIWMIALLGIGFSLAQPRSWLVPATVNFCLLFSPVVLILSVQMFTWPSWRDEPKTEFIVREADGPRTPVFVFVFDEWSWLRSSRCGELRPIFPNVRRLCDQAFLFREARSPYKSTIHSLPRLLFQNDLVLARRDGSTFWVTPEGEVPTVEVASIFQLAMEHGYNTYMLGWYLPFHRILGDQTDYCLSLPAFPKGETLPDEMLLATYRNLQFWTDPVSRKTWDIVHTDIISRYRYRINADCRREMFRIIDSSPNNKLAVFHVPTPHWPCVFNPDGSYFRCSALEHSPEDYERSLVHLDFYIGELLERLRDRGSFEDALIIITSDHACQTELDPTFRTDRDWVCRVPLIIKLPGQHSGRVIDHPFCTNQLKPLLDAVFVGQRNTEQLMELVESMASDMPRDSVDPISRPSENGT
jgi:hypothetical protein